VKQAKHFHAGGERGDVAHVFAVPLADADEVEGHAGHDAALSSKARMASRNVVNLPSTTPLVLTAVNEPSASLTTPRASRPSLT
jgi:hypothetical protein